MNDFLKKLFVSNYFKIALIIIIATTFILFNFKVFTTNNSINYDDPQAETELIPLNNVKLEQHFFASEAVRSIEIVLYQNPDAIVDGETRKVQLELFNSDSDLKLGSEEQTAKFTRGAAKFVFHFPDTESFSLAKYYITLKALDKQQLFVKVNLNEYREQLIINGEVVHQRFIFKANYSNNLLMAYFFWTLILLLLSLAILVFPHLFNLKPQQFFFMFAILSGIAITFISPTGQEPDGSDHILRAFDVSYGNVTPIFSQRDARYIYMPDDFSKFDDTVLEPNLNQGLIRTQNMMNEYFNLEQNGYQQYKYKFKYAVLPYWPQGLGMFLGRSLGMNTLYLLALARLINLLAYILMTYYAIKTIPIYKNLLVLIALLPISIFQAASLSVDPTVHGLSFIFIALVLRLFSQEGPIKVRQLLAPVIILYLVMLAKPAYLFLILMVLIIPLKRYPKFIASTIKAIIYFGFVVATGFILYGFYSGLFKWNEGLPVYATQTDFVLNNIGETLRIFLHTVEQNALQYVTWLNMLGWINYSLGPLVVIVPIMIVIVGFLDRDWAFELDYVQKSIVWATFLIIFSAIFVGMYVFDKINNIGASLMLGVQGRYFIPIMLLPFLTLSANPKIEKIDHFSQRVAGFTGLALTYTVFTLTRLIY